MPLGTIFLALSLLLAGHESDATITLTPTNGGSTGFYGNKVYYYVAPNTLTAPAFLLVPPLNVAIGTQNVAADSNYANVFKLKFYSTVATTVTNSQQYVIMITMNGTGTASPIPIATVNGTPCNDLICGARGYLPAYPGYYFSADYTVGATVEIGFYPNDACFFYNIQTNGTGQGCLFNAVQTVNPTTPVAMSLNFLLTTAADSGGATVPNPAPTGSPADTFNTAFLFQNSQGTFTCPSTVNSSYYPGDGQIFVDTTQFPFGPAANAAPASALYVVGQDVTANPSAVVLTDSNFQSNSVVSTGGLTIGDKNAGVPGFTNGDFYNVSFLMQDGAGIFYGFGTPSSCTIEKVETATIEGFVTKGNCFIATAAFHSDEAAPVLMLREFRDQVLNQFQWGRLFVEWYYSWSPTKAQWLEAHPLIRIPVLLALVPLEIVAWLFLYPSYLIPSFISVMILAVVLLVRSGKKRKGDLHAT